jgi:hypothetical protein
MSSGSRTGDHKEHRNIAEFPQCLIGSTCKFYESTTWVSDCNLNAMLGPFQLVLDQPCLSQVNLREKTAPKRIKIILNTSWNTWNMWIQTWKKMISMNKNPLTMFVFNGKLHETIITKFFPEIVRIYAASTPSVNGVDQTWQLNIPNGGFNLFFHGESSIHCYFHVRVGFHSWRRKFHPKICCDGIWMYCHGTI